MVLVRYDAHLTFTFPSHLGQQVKAVADWSSHSDCNHKELHSLNMAATDCLDGELTEEDGRVFKRLIGQVEVKEKDSEETNVLIVMTRWKGREVRMDVASRDSTPAIPTAWICSGQPQLLYRPIPHQPEGMYEDS